MNQLRSHIPHVFGSMASGVGAITAWQEHVDWLFRLGASSVAMIAGALTIASLIRKRKAE